MEMKRGRRQYPLTLFLGLVSIVLLLVSTGCGSGGSGNSPYGGGWSGSWHSTGDSQTLIPMTLTIDAKGNATGQVNGTGLAQSVLSGTISNSGAVDMQVGAINPPSVPPKLSGNVYLTTSGHLIGSLVMTSQGSPTATVTIDLILETPPVWSVNNAR